VTRRLASVPFSASGNYGLRYAARRGMGMEI
jgi:hypothetical protein